MKEREREKEAQVLKVRVNRKEPQMPESGSVSKLVPVVLCI